MIIKDIHLAGFKIYSPKDNLDIRSINRQQILSLRGENKRFIFKAILAIIFGMQKDEIAYFKAPGYNKVFTGRITLQYENNDIFIERDFATGVIAVLSDGKKAKSVFQGKSHTNLSPEDDPYQEFLQSIFTFIKKDELLSFCQPILDRSSGHLGEALNRLYLFLRPKFNIALLERQEKRTLFFLQNVNGELTQPRETTKSARIKLKLYTLLRQIDQGIKNIEHDKYLFEEFLATNNHELASGKNLQKRNRRTDEKHRLQQDIEMFQKMLVQSTEQHNQLNKLISQRNSIKSLISKELLVYADLPDTFEDDFHRFQEISTDITHQKIEYDRRNIQIQNLLDDIKSTKRTGITFSLISGSAILILGFILRPEWGLFNALMAAGAMIGIAAYFKRKTSFYFHLIDTSRRQQIDIRHQIKKYESEIALLREDAFLIDDLGAIDEHIQNFRKFKKLRGHLKRLDTQIKKIEQAVLPHINRTISQIEKRYPLVALSKPENQQQFLERMQSELRSIEQQEKISAPPEEHIRHIINQYGDLAERLKKSQQKLLQKMPPDTNPEQITNEVQRLNRFITFKTSGYDIIP